MKILRQENLFPGKVFKFELPEYELQLNEKKYLVDMHITHTHIHQPD
jgi:hypothetical protein